jgi:hypothetical protein
MTILDAIKETLEENTAYCMDCKADRARLFRAIKKKLTPLISPDTLAISGYKVSMASDLFGVDVFLYDSFPEAFDGMKRLNEKTKKLNDGIDRTFAISLVLEE